MCVYHYEDSKRAEMWIWMLLMGTILFSIGVSVPMFILTYPGDECLLFVSVRGEALIYGNPAGCNFISYGHCCLVLTAMVVLFLMFRRPKKGILRRKDPKEVGSTRSLRGSVPNGGMGQAQMARPNPMWTTCPNCKTEIVTTTHKRISTFQCLVAACFCFICPCCFWIPYCIGDWKCPSTIGKMCCILAPIATSPLARVKVITTFNLRTLLFSLVFQDSSVLKLLHLWGFQPFLH